MTEPFTINHNNNKNSITMFCILFIQLSFLTGCGVIAVSPCSIPTGNQFNNAKYALANSFEQTRFSRTAFDGNWHFLEGVQVHDNIRIRITCNKHVYGDASHQSTTSVCQDGVWSPALPPCKEYARCGAFPFFRAFASERWNADMTYPHGKEIKFRCWSSEHLTGNNTIVCFDGKWSSKKFSCHKHPMCSLPVVDGASILDGIGEGGLYRNGEFVYFECLAGKLLVGNNSIVCNAGNWSAVNFTCEQPPTVYAECGAFPYVKAIASERWSAGKTYPHGHEIKYRCRQWETFIGNNTIVCNDGRWSSIDFICRGVLDCHQPHVDGASIIDGHAQNYSNGSVVRFECLSGKQLIGDNTIVCNAGNWSKVDFICVEPPQAFMLRSPLPCSIPIGDHGAKFSVLWSYHRGIFPDSAFDGNESFNPGVSIPNDIDIKINCISNKTEYNSTCNDGRWSPALPNCRGKTTCPPKTVAGAQVYFSDDRVAKFKCEEGKKLTGNDTVVCINGNWSPVKFTCQTTVEEKASLTRTRYCPKLEIKGAYLRTRQKRFKHGAKVKYRCRPQHRRIGESRLTCQNGGWSEVSFFCLPKVIGCKRCIKSLNSKGNYMLF